MTEEESASWIGHLGSNYSCLPGLTWSDVHLARALPCRLAATDGYGGKRQA